MSDSTQVDAGVSNETHKQVKDELSQLREQLAQEKAKNQVYLERNREQIVTMKDDVNNFVNTIAKENPQHTELNMMCRWAAEMDKGDSLETNLGIGRLISCASANLKRTREEASQLTEKSSALAEAYKKIEALEAERDAKVLRNTELEGLLNERTDAATKLQEELAKHGAIKEKFDFSNPSAREAGSSADHASMASSSRSPAAPNMDDALFQFVSSGGRGGLRIGQSGTNHHLFGSTTGEPNIAAALRF
jgi:DNA repair exonuclease SbcCD ATPase subunit